MSNNQLSEAYQANLERKSKLEALGYKNVIILSLDMLVYVRKAFKKSEIICHASVGGNDFFYNIETNETLFTIIT